MAKVKLYEKFEDWYKGGVVWVISDTHFEDADCKLMSPDWPSPDEQVKIINSFVGKKDTLVHLGDVGNLEYIKQLKGYKVLITGNHDKGATNYKKKYSVTAKDKTVYYNTYKDVLDAKAEFNADYPNYKMMIVDNRLFDEVYEGPLFINEKILLSHEPIDLPFGINIHGHDHGGKHILKKENSLMINMAANVIKFTPLRLDKLVDGVKSETIHRITIDRATENPLHIK